MRLKRENRNMRINSEKMPFKTRCKKLLETLPSLKQYYICDYCGKFHVSSLSKSSKKHIDKVHSKRKINESVTRRLEYLKNKK